MNAPAPDLTLRPDVARASALIREIVETCPRRLAGSVSERHAHERLARELEAISRTRARASEGALDVELRPFRFNTHLYAVLALHFGIAVAGSCAAATGAWLLGLVLHLLAGLSYYGDSTRRYYWLRRLFSFKPSQNLIARARARGEPSLRVVLIAHVDAAYTGVLFHPTLIRQSVKQPPLPGLAFLNKSVLVATGAVFALALVDLISGAGLWSGAPRDVLLALLSVPPLVAFVLNLEVVLRDEVVPGANDNLTGSAATVALADRLVQRKPDDVELVFVVTGAEEAGTGGAYALAREVSLGPWKRANTVVLAIDGLSNGELRRIRDGELFALPPCPWLDDALDRVVASEARFSAVETMIIPAGATDAMPFRARGYDGVCLGCVDPHIGAPRHYHRSSDTPDNLDLEQYALSIDFIERVVDELIAARDTR